MKWCDSGLLLVHLLDGSCWVADPVRERGMYKILGRASMDIIKSGGYKVGALVTLPSPQGKYIFHRCPVCLGDTDLGTGY